MDEPLIVEVRLGNYQLSDAMFVFPAEGQLKLPLLELMQILNFPIKQQQDSELIQGWFIRENRRFEFDPVTGNVTVEERNYSLNAEQYLEDFGEYYIDSEQLTQWFPIGIDTDLSQLRLTITPRELLPMQEQWERSKGWGRSRQNTLESKMPIDDYSHKVIGLPQFEANISSQNSKYDSSHLYDAQANFDFLGMGTTLSFGGEKQDAVSRARLNMYRQFPKGGPLGLTQLELGDISSSGFQGAGALLSSYEVDRPDDFGSTELTGDILPGWDVELYRNGSLFYSQRASSDGRYVFEDIPLLLGSNELRLKFYGPQGQVREKVENYYVGQRKPGETRWKATVLANEFNLVKSSESEIDKSLEDEPVAEFEIEHSFSRKLSIGTTVATIPTENGNEVLGEVWLGSSFAGMLHELSWQQDEQSTSSIIWSGKTEVFDISAFASHEYTTESDPDLNGREHYTTLRLDGGQLSWLPIRWNMIYSREVETSGTAENTLSVGNSYNNVYFNISQRTLMEPSDYITSEFSINSYFYNWRFRSRFNTMWQPDVAFQNASFELSRRWNNKGNLSLGVDYSNDSDEFAYGIRYDQYFDWFDFGVDATFDGEESAVGFTLGFAFGVEPHSNSLYLAKDRNAKPTASARVFLDSNNNGIFDDNDELLPDVQFNSSSGKSKTDEDGIALLAAGHGGQTGEVVMDLASLPDPYMIPIREGTRFVSGIGSLVSLNFPVVMSGEIDGTVTFVTSGKEKQVSNVELELVDNSGSIVATTKTAYDGFYLFSQVKPGDYQLRISPKQLDKLGLQQVTPKNIKIGTDGDVLSNIDFELIKMQMAEKTELVL